jgi:hypothetical protein
MPNINESFPSNYLKASDLQGRPVVVTIKEIKFESVGREKDMKAVVYFVGKDKGIVLNKTNAKKITEITGSPLTEEWEGHAIVIYPTETEFAGETVECIRVKPVKTSAMSRMTPHPTPARLSTAAVAEDASDPLTDDDDDIPF